MRANPGSTAAILSSVPYLTTAAQLVWGTIGDSWDSGVAYNDDVTYDNNADQCLRLIDAYGAQMASDQSWVTDGQNFTFAGCSGAVLSDMVASGGQQQLQKISKPAFIVMTAGGNNAGFGSIVDACIYHGDPGTDYGKPYDIDPNGVGLCKKSLATANSYVTSTSTNPNEGLAIDVKNTIDDIFRNIAGAGQELFSLYLTGYAHFFNVDPETDFCNGWSFAPFFVVKNIPLLTLDLRTTFNDYVENFNNVYRDVIANYQVPDGVPGNYVVHYVSITEGFNGGRFCEPHTSYNDQWYSDDVLLWNLNLWASTQTITDEGTVSTADQGTPVNTTDNNTTQLQPPSGVNEDTVPGGLTAWSNAGCGGGNVVNKGWCRRPFHPKHKGHTAIKDAVIAALRADNFPSVAHSAAPTTSAPAPTSTCPTNPNPGCSECPAGYGNCSPSGGDTVCVCNDPCANFLCLGP